MPRARKEPRIVDHVSDSDDEEIPEDEAFNSEDERKYGAFFHDSDDEASSDSDDGIASDDDDEEEGDGGQYMLDLLNQLDNDKSTAADINNGALAVHVQESEFASSVVGKTNLTLDSLMEGLQDTRGFRDMQKTLGKVAQGKSTSTPVAKVVSERARRKVHYEQQTDNISQWMEAVQENRQAETLDFRHKERMDVTKDDLVEKFVPTTDFEKELHAALQQAGQQDEQAILEAEEKMMHNDDDLGSNKLTMEEYKQRRAQMAKMRALMFYHEQKRHHMNKIKSKKYRRIRKKQRERLKEAEVAAQVDEDPDVARELQEKEEIERMKERMTLAHKNTSKWAKRVLKRGKNVDQDTRRALSAQLQRGEDLRKKMNATRDDDEESDDENEDLVDTARKVLADTEDDVPVKNTGLFKLSFMQRGIEAQRERAKQEARQLLQELEANENDDQKDDSDEEQPPLNDDKPAKKKAATSSEMKSVLPEGKLVAASLEFGNSNSIAVSGGIDIDLSQHGVQLEPSTEGAAKSSSSEHTSTLEVAENTDVAMTVAATDPPVGTKANSRAQAASVQRATAASTNQAEEANPWLAAATTDSGAASNKKKTSKHAKSKKRGMVDVNSAVALLDGGNDPIDRKQRKTDNVAPPGDEAESNKKIASLTQEELVQRAFATAPEHAEEEFAKEKATVAERDDPTRKRKEESAKVSTGWGSWAGEGVPPPKPPRKFPKKLQPPEKRLPKRKRQDDKKPHVIINEKRLKKTANFQMGNIPYPYKSREEYERAMSGAVGKEWNVTSAVKDMTRPEVMTRAGKIIQPLSKQVKKRRPRPAAKF